MFFKDSDVKGHQNSWGGSGQSSGPDSRPCPFTPAHPPANVGTVPQETTSTSPRHHTAAPWPSSFPGSSMGMSALSSPSLTHPSKPNTVL